MSILCSNSYGQKVFKVFVQELRVDSPEPRAKSPDLIPLPEDDDRSPELSCAARCTVPGPSPSLLYSGSLVKASEPKANVEFKLPNLEDFELRSKTPKKVVISNRLQSSVTSSSSSATVTSVAVKHTSPESTNPVLDDSDGDDSPILAKKRKFNAALKLDSSNSSDESPEINRKYQRLGTKLFIIN